MSLTSTVGLGLMLWVDDSVHPASEVSLEIAGNVNCFTHLRKYPSSVSTV